MLTHHIAHRSEAVISLPWQNAPTAKIPLIHQCLKHILPMRTPPRGKEQYERLRGYASNADDVEVLLQGGTTNYDIKGTPRWLLCCEIRKVV